MRVAFIVVPLVLIAAIAGLVFWKIASLKQRLVADLESELHAKAQIASLSLDLGAGELHAAGIALQNQRPEAPWDTAAIDQVSVHFKWGDLFAPTLPVQIKVTGWKANFHTTADEPRADANTTPDTTATPSDDTLDRRRVRVTTIAATQGDVTVRLSDTQKITVRGVTFHADASGDTDWTTQLQAASIDAQSLQAGASSVHLHSNADKIEFSDLAVHCGDGQVTGNGDLELRAPHALQGTFTAASVPLNLLVSVRWQMKVAGLVSGDVTYQGDDNTATATGKMSVANGKFNLFPWLGKATALVGLPDITDTTVDQATANFTWKSHLLTLEDIDIRKKDVFRIAGQATVAADDTCDGHLKLGLPTTAVSKWPKLQTDVFSDAHDDFSWANVHITGTPDHLDEDLSMRLLAVGAAQGGQLIQQTTQKAGDLLNSLLK